MPSSGPTETTAKRALLVVLCALLAVVALVAVVGHLRRQADRPQAQPAASDAQRFNPAVAAVGQDRCGPEPNSATIVNIGQSMVARAYAPASVSGATCTLKGAAPYPRCWQVECRMTETAWRASEPHESVYGHSVIVSADATTADSAVSDSRSRPLPGPTVGTPRAAFDELIAQAEDSGRRMRPDETAEALDLAATAAKRLTAAERTAALALVSQIRQDVGLLWARSAEIKLAAARRLVGDANLPAAAAACSDAIEMVRLAEKHASRALRIEANSMRESIAQARICGGIPALSTWDGEVIGAERHLKQSAHDPSSIDVADCSEPQLTKDRCWLTTCNVRGRNTYGALVLSRWRFWVGRENTILGAKPLD